MTVVITPSTKIIQMLGHGASRLNYTKRLVCREMFTKQKITEMYQTSEIDEKKPYQSSGFWFSKWKETAFKVKAFIFSSTDEFVLKFLKNSKWFPHVWRGFWLSLKSTSSALERLCIMCRCYQHLAWFSFILEIISEKSKWRSTVSEWISFLVLWQQTARYVYKFIHPC